MAHQSWPNTMVASAKNLSMISTLQSTPLYRNEEFLRDLYRGYSTPDLINMLSTNITIIFTKPGMPSQSNSLFTSVISCEKEKFCKLNSEPICKDNLFDDFNIEEGLLALNPFTWINKDKKTVRSLFIKNVL